MPVGKGAAARETLNIRVQAETRGLIDLAARTRGKTRTDFILEAATRAAEDVLLDRALLSVDSKGYAKFIARLDAPARPNARLRKTMAAPPPWKTDESK